MYCIGISTTTKKLQRRLDQKLKFFGISYSLDIKIHELYGMSESSGPHTFQVILKTIFVINDDDKCRL